MENNKTAKVYRYVVLRFIGQVQFASDFDPVRDYFASNVHGHRISADSGEQVGNKGNLAGGEVTYPTIPIQWWDFRYG